VPYYLYLNPDYIYVIGVDVGLLQTTVALSDFTGRILEREIFVTEKDRQGFTSSLLSAMKPLVDKAKARSHLDGIGIAVPGLVDNSGKIRLAPNLGWADFDLGPILKDEFGVPVYVENVSKSAALAHLWQDDDLPSVGKNYVYVLVSSGIGTGLVFNGQLHAGFSGTAGEFGHMVIDRNGPECNCGNRGCWEVLADNRSALRRYVQKVPHASGKSLTIQELVAIAREGNEAAREAIAETAEYLAIGIGNILVSLNPECVIVDGELTKVWDILGEVIEKSLKRGAFALELEHMRIIPSAMKLKPSLVGAISSALSGHFAPPTFSF
jgi:predicted NBD/HSP70 family sugar kinase